ncbi:MAG: glycoside hydrolase family 5 protein [Deltaproteobacteria bacterium]|nr:glycoside hydrolase family 5 protein [Deltaproteobacteria bacterium]
MALWDQPRRGTNYFAAPMTPAWIRAARATGVGWVRLSSAAWPREDGDDHLLGSADDYTTLVADHLDLLRDQLDLAHAEGMPVVFTMLSLPGARWRQHNDDTNDLRLWTLPERFQPQATRFWADLVEQLGDHPALVAVNILNEPRPPDPEALGPFYARTIEAIRAVHPTLPIMVDVGVDAAPSTIEDLAPLADPHVLYAVHVYEPWDLVTWRVHRGARRYPGADGAGRPIDAAFLQRTLAPVGAWQRRHQIPSRRIVMAEFGIDRRIEGAATYLHDVLCIAETQGWHWGFYAFRDWQAMDYEVGPRPLPPGYWAAQERGEPIALTRGPNPQLEVLRQALAGDLLGCPPVASDP